MITVEAWFEKRARDDSFCPTDFPNLAEVAAISLENAESSKPLPEARPEMLTAADDPAERIRQTGEYTRTVDLDRVNFAIDYIDTEGKVTRRAVTIQSVGSKGIFPMMEAFCHLRNQTRSFRIDRIQSIITRDGEVIDPARYFLEALNIDLRLFAKIDKDTLDDPLAQARQCRKVLRPALALLVLAARSDGKFHRAELNAIEIYAERELLEMERLGRAGVTVNVAMLDQLRKVIRDLRPDPGIVRFYLAELQSWNIAARKRFWSAVNEVVIADGLLREEESDFLEFLDSMKRD